MKVILLFSLIVLSFCLLKSESSEYYPQYSYSEDVEWEFTYKGWKPNAIYGMLGNMQWESKGIYPDLDNMVEEAGYGIVQWNPGTILLDWAEKNGLDYDNIFTQCDRIHWEMENNVRYIKSKCSYANYSEFS